MEKRITSWLEKGIIDKQTALALLAEIKIEKAKNHKLGLNIVIYTIAIVLIGIGVISFIAANDWLLALFAKFEIIKVILAMIVTSVSLLGGYHLAYEKKNFPRLGKALIFLSALLIGATYALIGQTYNINANNAGLMFLWLFSILPMVFVYKSFAINIVSIILYILGTCFLFGGLDTPKEATNFAFVPLFVGCSLYVFGNIPVILEKFNNYSLAYKLAGLFPIFSMLLIFTCIDDIDFQTENPVYYIALFLVLIVNLINLFINKKDKNDNLLNIETMFISTILVFLLMLLAIPNINAIFTMLLAHISIITIIAYGYNYGYKFKDSKIVNTVNWYLVIYLIVNYCRWSWDFMEKTLFFLIGGITLLSLGIFLERKQRSLK